ncbi:MAG: hypothetical protein FWG31_03280 [Oscillospiraceae bacterium]|nr:hypothetical protein [Oscillospiraceae bacterium]
MSRERAGGHCPARSILVTIWLLSIRNSNQFYERIQKANLQNCLIINAYSKPQNATKGVIHNSDSRGRGFESRRAYQLLHRRTLNGFAYRYVYGIFAGIAEDFYAGIVTAVQGHLYAARSALTKRKKQ